MTDHDISFSGNVVCEIIFLYLCVTFKECTFAFDRCLVSLYWIIVKVFQNSNYQCIYIVCPMQLSHSDWKTCIKGKVFSSQGILNRLEKSGKITQNTGKVGEVHGCPTSEKNQGKAIFLKSGNFGHLIPFFTVTLLGIRSYIHSQMWQTWCCLNQ